MKHVIHQISGTGKYPIAILVKERNLIKSDLETHYVNKLEAMGLPRNDIISFSLDYNVNNKAPVSLIRAYLKILLKALKGINTSTLIVADSNYFKTLTGSPTAEPHHGYILPCVIKGYENMSVILSINYVMLFHNPSLQSRIDMSLSTVFDHIQGTHINLGTDIIHFEEYPSTFKAIEVWLQKLLNYPELACDIEAFSLEFHKAGIGTISFAWSKHEGIAFRVDLNNDRQNRNGIRGLLAKFFREYTGKLTYHGGNYDIKVLIYVLYMEELLDNEGLLNGLEIMYRSIDDTKTITYLATNTTSSNKLDLKSNAFEFAGNWAQDEIKDITLIPVPELLRYNLVDSLATWYIKEKNYPIMVQDNQEEIYHEIMIPSMKVICHMELTGMPIDMYQVDQVAGQLLDLKEDYMAELDNPLIWDFEKYLQLEALVTKQKSLKVKKVFLKDFVNVMYNPASNKQTAELLYGQFKLPIIDLTDTGQPAVGATTLKKLLNQLVLEHNITEEELK